MGNHDDGVRLTGVIDGRADAALADIIERGCSFIENEDGRIFQKHSGERNALTLAAGKISAAFGQRGLVASWHLQNFFVNVRLTRSFVNLFEVNFAAAITDVLSNRSGKSKRRRTDVADALADIFA